MSELRGLRLLNAVENGTVSGAQLEGFLSDVGRLAEFTVLLSQKGQTNRIANAQTTMTAVVSSMTANKAIFLQATEGNSAAVEAVVKSSIAMSTVSDNIDSLKLISDNTVSWKFFSQSSHYETNLKNILARLAGLDPTLYATTNALVLDPVSMGDISASSRAMRAVASSLPVTTVMAGDSVAMALVAANTVAITIIAVTTTIMPTVANSAAAMSEITSRSAASSIMSSNVGSIKAISLNSAAWATFRAGTFFSANLKVIIANLIGLNPLSYADVNAIIADAAALSILASNSQAVQALMASSSAMTTLAVSPNIGSILSSTKAMALIGPSTSSMSSFLNASGAWAGLFASSVAKGYIVGSTALVDIIAGNATLITYLKTISVVASATGIPDGNATSLQPFAGIPSKVLVLQAKETGIAATFSPYNFGGTPMSGTQAGASISLTAAAQLAHVAGYTNMTWNLQGIGVTAATLPIITYVDMS